MTCARDATRPARSRSRPRAPNPSVPLPRGVQPGEARRVTGHGARPTETQHQSGEWGVVRARGMAATRGGGSASRVGDGDVDLGDGWGWCAIPRLLSSACLFFCSGGCFGCCDKAVKRLGELSRNLITHDEITIGETFWSTTTIEVEPADLRGVSSNWGFDQHGTGSSHNLPGNNGVVLWEQTRQEWTEIRSLRPKVKQVREPVLRYGRMR
ncbi:hypothetical protein BS78_03G048200 [Paspalum vaginatum]|nr:hypothetical protein BS78_03G048200 [Paspalum vaginatum]